jgi:peptidoglycan/xylan/chitin deacetylase (PgdA/CDA1 family)
VPFLLAAGLAVPAVAVTMLRRWAAAREVWPRSARNLTKEVLRRAVTSTLRTGSKPPPVGDRSEDRARAIAEKARATVFTAEPLPNPPQTPKVRDGAPDPGRLQPVRRGGGILDPADVAHERRTKVPILTYSRIGAHEAAGDVPPDAFAAQLDTLRRHGHHTISLARFWAYRLARRPLAGRPVIIAFHNADASARRLAWPLLERYGFTAEVFVNVDRIGEGGKHDAEPMLTWREIGEMHAQGARFGCFIFERDVWPRAVADFLSTAARHRALLERELGVEIHAVALSSDYADALAVRGAQLAGFRQIFAGGSDFADVESCEITLPKVEVSGRESLGMFVEKLRYDSFDPDE